MQQRNDQQAEGSQGRQASTHFSGLALRSIGQVYDMHLSAARVLMQTQARAASAIGLPDWSGVFNSVDDRARRLFSSGAEQLLNRTRRASEAASELQREFGRVMETQAATVADTLQQGLEEIQSQADEGLTQLVQTAREQADAAERVASSLGEEMRNTLKEGGEQAREQMRRGQQALTEAANQTSDEVEEAAADEPESREHKSVRRHK